MSEIFFKIERIGSAQLNTAHSVKEHSLVLARLSLTSLIQAPLGAQCANLLIKEHRVKIWTSEQMLLVTI